MILLYSEGVFYIKRGNIYFVYIYRHNKAFALKLRVKATDVNDCDDRSHLNYTAPICIYSFFRYDVFRGKSFKLQHH